MLRSSNRVSGEHVTKLPLDSEGYIDRQCPVETCEGFFKVRSGTGIAGTGDPAVDECICPYCGHRGFHNTFYSKTQVEFGLASAKRHLENEFHQMMKDAVGSSNHMTLTTRQTTPTPRYAHKILPTALVCSKCTCEYKVSGDQGRCPDCGNLNIP